MDSTPGASVRAQYERRRRARRVLLGAALVAGLAVSRVDVTSGVALALVCIAVVWIRRRGDGRYRAGVVGEEATASALEPLERRGFTVLHDLGVPGRRENIDHLVIGRAGVFVVETKKWAGEVTIGWRLRQNGDDRTNAIEQAMRQADAVAVALDVEVRPVVCVHGATVRRRWFRRRPVVGGVTVLEPQQLVAHVGGRRRRRLRRREVDRLAATARERFRPALGRAVRTCRCGGELVVRTARDTGERFLGCSNYPRCRQTAPLVPA